MLWSGAIIRVHWHPDQQTILLLLEARLVGIESMVNQQNSCDQELVLELIDPMIDQQTCFWPHWLLIEQRTFYDRELLSELSD